MPHSSAAQEKFDNGKACETAISLAGTMNYEKLVGSAPICEQAGDIVGGTYLFLISQVRFGTDSELLFPADEAARQQRAMRSQYLYYRAGGSGPDTLYRDREKREKLYRMLEGWTASMPHQYDPGWKYKRPPSSADVAETSERHKYNRIQKLKWYAALIANDAYYAAKQSLSELSRKNNGRFSPNTPAYEEYSALIKTMNRVQTEMDLAEPNRKEPPFIRVDPDADFRPILSGVNGREKASWLLISSPDEIKTSFLQKALTAPQIAQILAEIDFKTEILVALNIGKRTTATGKLVVTELSVSGLDRKPAISSSVRIGVIENGCTFPPKASYPFIVMAKKRPSAPNLPLKRGWYRGNFPDGCKVPASGTPNN